MTTTYVVSRTAGKGTWFVTNNDGVENGPFKNWVVAVDFARSVAVDEGAEIMRLSAKTGDVIEVLKPRARVSARTRRAANDFAPAPTSLDDILAQVGAVTFTEDELRNMPASKLLALFNETTGGSAKVLKRGRAVAAVLAA